MDDEETTKDSELSSDKKGEAKDKLVAPISEKEKISKESIKTEKVTNTSNFISKL